MIKYKPVEDSHPCCPVASEQEKDAPKLPRSYIVVPKGAKIPGLNEMVEITIRGKVKGFSEQEWNDTDEIRIELHEGDIRPYESGQEFSDLADD